jgi:hypothetical protein
VVAQSQCRIGGEFPQRPWRSARTDRFRPTRTGRGHGLNRPPAVSPDVPSLYMLADDPTDEIMLVENFR